MAEAAAHQIAGIAPHLTIREGKANAAMDFYQKAFGAQEIGRHLADDGKRVMHGHLKINGGDLLLNDDFVEHTGGVPVPAGVTIHLQVDAPDEWWSRAVSAGATIAMPLEDQFWGDRYGQLVDPFGHRWSIGGPKKG